MDIWTYIYISLLSIFSVLSLSQFSEIHSPGCSHPSCDDALDQSILTFHAVIYCLLGNVRLGHYLCFARHMSSRLSATLK